MESFSLWLSENTGSQLFAQLNALKALIAKEAQIVYDSWEPEDECDMGGICDEIAREVMTVVSRVPGVSVVDGGHDGDDHAWVIAHDGMKAYGVDIPPEVYETGGGYCWKKIPGVKFTVRDVQIWDLGLSIQQIQQLD